MYYEYVKIEFHLYEVTWEYKHTVYKRYHVFGKNSIMNNIVIEEQMKQTVYIVQALIWFQI